MVTRPSASPTETFRRSKTEFLSTYWLSFVVIGIIAILFADYFVKGGVPYAQNVQFTIARIAPFSLPLAYYTFVRYHVRQITIRARRWYNSIIVLVTFVVTFAYTMGATITGRSFSLEYLQIFRIFNDDLPSALFGLIALSITSAFSVGFLMRKPQHVDLFIFCLLGIMFSTPLMPIIAAPLIPVINYMVGQNIGAAEFTITSHYQSVVGMMAMLTILAQVLTLRERLRPEASSSGGGG